jgi:hypothetical protein
MSKRIFCKGQRMGLSSRYRLLVAYAFLASASCALTACATNHAVQANASEPLPTMVRLAPSVRIFLTGGLYGRIEVHNGCVDLVSMQGDVSRHVVWPDSYELTVLNGRAIGIRDTASGQSLRFGKYVELGGGEWNVDSLAAVEAIPPENCRGKSVMAYFDY